MKFGLVFLVSILVVATGCVTERQRTRICLQCGSKTDSTATSQTTTQTIYQDVVIPPDSAWYKAWVECKNGIPTVVEETTYGNAELLIRSLIVNKDSSRVGIFSKAIKKAKIVSVPGQKSTENHSAVVERSLQAAPHACPRSRWWVWLLVGIGIAQLFNVVWRKVSKALGKSPLKWISFKLFG